jgi:hypothetical protein
LPALAEPKVLQLFQEIHMRLDFFKTRADAHIGKAREYLQQAHLARIDHQTAAEHHAALAAMYAQRAIWLEQELSNAGTPGAWPASGAVTHQVEGPKQASSSVVSRFRA